MTADPACWHDALPGLRTRLVRRARQLGVDAEAAEDLAQETLYEAWRSRDRLHDPSGVERWLFAILGNVHRRWMRRHGRDRSRLAPNPIGPEPPGVESGTLDVPADDRFDVEVELERRELADLLDRAMALLPVETRDLLVQRFVDETPMSELAARLGMSQGAVQMRVQRGKLALHRVLTTDYGADAVAFGLIDDAEAGWQETRIWCPACGAARWQGRFTGPDRTLELRCDRCHELDVVCTGTRRFGVAGFRATLRKVEADAYDFWRDGVRGLNACRHQPVLRKDVTPTGRHIMDAECLECRSFNCSTLDGQALASPEGRRFWREHPRIRRIAYENLEAGGVPAVLTSYESVTDNARLDVVLTRDTYHVVRTHDS
jgi:RNA polymerase sigma factor (sigma-70 family)